MKLNLKLESKIITTMQSIVNQVLETDSKYRYEGVMDDLFTLEELKPVQWDFSLPTLTRSKSPDPYIENTKSIVTFDDFMSKYNKYCGKYFDGFDMSNVLLAGGSVSDMLMNSFFCPKDYDIFIYGLDEKEASQKVELLVSHLISKCKESKGMKNNKIQVTRTKNVINISHNTPVQIILRLYRTKSEVLHGFDIGSCAVGFDGKDVLFTSLSKFAYETNCNIIDVTRRSLTYENRLSKYFSKGFDIIMPDLKVPENLNKRSKLVLPYCTLCLQSVQGNKLTCFDIKHHNEISDYYSELNEDPYFVYLDSLLKYNIKMLLRDEPNNLIGSKCYRFITSQETSSTEDYTCTLYNLEYVTRKKIEYFYDSLPFKILENQGFNYTILSTYTSVILSEFVLTFFSKQSQEEKSAYVQQVCNTEKKNLLSKWDKVENQVKSHNSVLHWMIENPGKQFTSSFNPVLSTPQDWYGEFLNSPVCKKD